MHARARARERTGKWKKLAALKISKSPDNKRWTRETFVPKSQREQLNKIKRLSREIKKKNTAEVFFPPPSPPLYMHEPINTETDLMSSTSLFSVHVTKEPSSLRSTVNWKISPGNSLTNNNNGCGKIREIADDKRVCFFPSKESRQTPIRVVRRVRSYQKGREREREKRRKK